MGELWDLLSGDLERRASEKILREKLPAVRGVSAETFEAIQAGELVLDDDDPRAQLIVGSAPSQDDDQDDDPPLGLA